MVNYEYELIIDGNIINLTCTRKTANNICGMLVDDGCCVRLLDKFSGMVYFQNYEGDYVGNQ